MNTREIDRLVAEKVMGWKYEYIEKVDRYGFMDKKGFVYFDFFPTDFYAHAFMVLEKFDLVDIQKTKDSYLISIHHNDGVYFAEGEDFCLQVCLAALKAVGVEGGVLK
jgi:hypothetical protein